jgi:ribosomal protein S18 acetylase RimI-like enzyme
MSPAAIRPYEARDLDALHHICLKTGDSGADGTHLYADPRIIGEIYAAPYGVLQPDLAFVAEDDQGVAAYVVGAADTRAFEARLEAEWWPGVRARYADPRGTPKDGWTADQWRAYQIHRPFLTPQAVVDAAPAHLHINLLPRLQGQGMGKALVETLLGALAAQGVEKVHLGCSAENPRALRFYDIYGFQRLEPADGRPETVWMTLDVPPERPRR